MQKVIGESQFLRSNPDYAEAYSNLGNALLELKRFDEAVASFDEAIRCKPDLAEAYLNRGNAFQELLRFDEVIACYDEAIRLNPDYTDAYSNRGNTLQKLKRYAEAVACYDAAIRLKPDYAEAYWNKSLLSILTGDFIKGWELYEWGWSAGSRKPLRKYDNAPSRLGLPKDRGDFHLFGTRIGRQHSVLPLRQAPGKQACESRS